MRTFLRPNTWVNSGGTQRGYTVRVNRKKRDHQSAGDNPAVCFTRCSAFAPMTVLVRRNKLPMNSTPLAFVLLCYCSVCRRNCAYSMSFFWFASLRLFAMVVNSIKRDVVSGGSMMPAA